MKTKIKNPSLGGKQQGFLVYDEKCRQITTKTKNPSLVSERAAGESRSGQRTSLGAGNGRALERAADESWSPGADF